MKTNFKTSTFTVVMLICLNAFSQKKVHKVSISDTINASAEKVWKVVGEDFGNIYKSHAKIVNSNYINNSDKAEVRAQRVCYFNEKGTKYVKEEITEFNPENYSCKITIIEAKRIPINTGYSYAIQRIVPIDDNTSVFVMDFYYRTKPAFLGGMAKGSFRKGLKEYAMTIEHHILTGQIVDKKVLKQIKKQHKS